jgi:hypothetical protein
MWITRCCEPSSEDLSLRHISHSVMFRTKSVGLIAGEPRQSRLGRNMSKVVYVTGAPAAAKSSTLRLLVEHVPDVVHWEYGARLTELLQARGSEIRTQDGVRARSAGVVTPADIAELDDRLLAFVEENRGRRPVLYRQPCRHQRTIWLSGHSFLISADPAVGT